jgi:hypothetical protein
MLGLLMLVLKQIRKRRGSWKDLPEIQALPRATGALAILLQKMGKEGKHLSVYVWGDLESIFSTTKRFGTKM